ncbi:MAG: hypothetical protein EA374_06555 [Acholeplasmatales bacterium]|nr:MAG: hypothetical protein EA374_06555 [Acholeplasmatales bacterium]
MKTHHVIVPRAVVKHFLPHPEPYGEALVVLLNDMWTDVYTNDANQLYTPTNDKALIRYLKSCTVTEPSFSHQAGQLQVRSATFSDVPTLAAWPIPPNPFLGTPCENQEEAARMMVSHGLTANSHLFLIFIAKKPIGTLKTTSTGSTLCFEMALYARDAVAMRVFFEGVPSLVAFLKQVQGYKTLYALIDENDVALKTLFETLGSSFKSPPPCFSDTYSEQAVIVYSLYG